MSRYRSYIQRILVFAAGVLSIFLLLPVSASATCSIGTVPTSSGTCCPAGQEQITAGTVSCPSQTNTNCGANVNGQQALQCLADRYLNPFIALLSAAVGIIIVISIIRGALEYTTSGGDPSKAAAGKAHIVNALIGLAAYVALYAFLQFLIPGGLFNGG